MKNKELIYLYCIVYLVMIVMRLPMYLRYSGSFYPMIGIVFIQYIFSIYLIKRLNVFVLIKDAKWIIISISLLIIYNLIDYGNKTGLYSHTLVLISASPAFIYGYYLGYNDGRKVIEFIATILYLIVLIYSVSFNLGLGEGAYINNDITDPLFIGKRAFILYWPFVFVISSIAFLSLMSIYKNNKFILILLSSSYIVIFISIIKSEFTTPIILAAIYFILVFLFKSRQTLRTLLLTFVCIAMTLILLDYLGNSDFVYEGTRNELRSFSSFFGGGDLDGFDNATNGRISLLTISIKSFWESPIIGKGGYWGYQRAEMVSSQHSSILDILAFYGMTGIPILMIYINLWKSYFAMNSHNIKNKIWDPLIVSFLSAISAIIVLAMLNPYLLTYVPSDGFYFLMSGYILGNNRIRTIRKLFQIQNISSLRRPTLSTPKNLLFL